MDWLSLAVDTVNGGAFLSPGEKLILSGGSVDHLPDDTFICHRWGIEVGDCGY